MGVQETHFTPVYVFNENCSCVLSNSSKNYSLLCSKLSFVMQILFYKNNILHFVTDLL